jgi:hypothetical protein
MSSLFPTTQDDATTLPNPAGTDKTNSPDHASLHGNANDAIKAVEAKVGTGASTPTANTLLRGNGVGTSVWGQLTSAQLAASLSDETGTGAAVFATTPTLVTPQVDTINESTPTNGVTIDGLNVKDSKLNTNNSVVTANITDSAVTPAKLQSGTGSSWAWQSWTPTWTNLTVGNGTNASTYTQIGKTVHFRLKFVLGTTSAVGSAPVFTLPVTSVNYGSPYNAVIGQLAVRDDNVPSNIPGFVWWASTTTAEPDVMNAAGTYVMRLPKC